VERSRGAGAAVGGAGAGSRGPGRRPCSSGSCGSTTRCVVRCRRRAGGGCPGGRGGPALVGGVLCTRMTTTGRPVKHFVL